nr:hypothetical protein [Tanacetum cinerariifolium]
VASIEGDHGRRVEVSGHAHRPAGRIALANFDQCRGGVSRAE